MLYDRRDFGLLRLAGTYQWLPAAPLKKLSALKTLRREAELLSTLGLVSYARSGEYLMPSPQGYEFLSGIDQTCQPPTKRPYAQSPALRRRLEVGTILLTCIGAGIEPAFGKVEHLKRQPVFFPRLCPPKRRRQPDERRRLRRIRPLGLYRLYDAVRQRAEHRLCNDQ